MGDSGGNCVNVNGKGTMNAVLLNVSTSIDDRHDGSEN